MDQHRALPHLTEDGVWAEGDVGCDAFPCGYTGIKELYLNRLPQGISVDAARLAIAGDRAARNQLQMVLQNYNRDLDGMMASPGAALYFLSAPVEQGVLDVQTLNRLVQPLVVDMPRRNP